MFIFYYDSPSIFIHLSVPWDQQIGLRGQRGRRKIWWAGGVNSVSPGNKLVDRPHPPSPRPAFIKSIVYDSGESLLIFELNSQTNKQTPPFSAPLNSISLSCVWARVVTYYTKVFSGNAENVGIWRPGLVALPEPLCFLFIELGLCMNTGLFFQCTHRTES